MTVFHVIAFVLSVGSLLGGAVYAVHRYRAEMAAARQAAVDEQAELARVQAMDAAAAAARASREDKFDAKAAAAGTPAAAADLLREATGGAPH